MRVASGVGVHVDRLATCWAQENVKDETRGFSQREAAAAAQAAQQQHSGLD